MTRNSGAVDHETVVRIMADSTDGAAVLAAAQEAATGVPVVEVGTTGVHGLDPLVAVTRDGRTVYHAAVSPDRARTLVAAVDDESLPTDDALAVVDHGSGQATLPMPAEGPLSHGTRHVLGPCGWVAPTVPQDYGEFVSPTVQDDPETALATVRRVGLLGRGRGDARVDDPIAPAWETARDADGESVVVVNANESERGNRTDRTLLGSAPLAVLDGAVTVAHVIDADDVVVYLNETDEVVRRRVEGAVSAMAEDDWTIVPAVVTGPDRYIAGEPTMALESLEGNDRLEARLRPPGPATHGLYGRPTVVHTPRTFAQVRHLLQNPEDTTRFDPADADPGTRLVTVTGDVQSRVTLELPTGGSLATAREAVAVDGRFKMACVGGRFGGLTQSLDCSPSAPALAAADLGTEGVVQVCNDERCAVAVAGHRGRFAKDENCGRCVPCREGSKQLTNKLRAIYDGTYDGDGIRELTRVMRETSTCDFGRHAPRPVTTAMDRFETEFRAHADGRCPAGACGGGQ
ncbi:NADH-ubiquinone oxidoreductase-F iron-sulfur binding region domain-containing protein [Haloarchaeobius sp. DFWS5]|uniref:NADH-ubiquinone oxidoreductase-F iron-sulfur binding region domain-containing protein n=1 Tax=Haloarchaeobius sp. DFWS5 TaxID=3446114 RepID=UPI003EB79DD7